MATTKVKGPQTQVGVDGWFNRQVASFEKSRFAWMTIFLTAQSCLGSIACMFILQNKASDMALATCAAITMACNAMFIAQAPGKWCLLSFAGSVTFNSVFILANL